MRKTTIGVSRPLLVLLLFVSGAAALVYQALWVKQIGILVGVEVYAVTSVVSAFFAGLAIGGILLGKWVDASRRPMAFYAWIELGIAIGGLTTTLLLSSMTAPYLALEERIGRVAWILPFVLVGGPAFFMGGTLPALICVGRPRQAAIGATSGLLYAANTAGAVCGVLACPFALVPAFGVRGAGIAAAVMNLALALLAGILSRQSAEVAATPGREASGARAAAGASASSSAAGSRLALALYAAAGGLALGFEVVWSQAVVQFINTRAVAFALVLATYLSGLVLGSFLWARFTDRVRHPWRTFGVLEIGVGLTALTCFALLGPWVADLQARAGANVFALLGSTASSAVATATAPAALLLLPTILLGAAFPAVARLACGPQHIGRDIGTVAALNTLGGIAGTLLTGFVLVPLLGVARTVAVLSAGTVLIGAVAWVRGSAVLVARPAQSVLLVVLATTVALGLASFVLPSDHLARVLVATRRGGSLDFYRESPGGTVAVVKEPMARSHFHRLYIHGISNSADHMMSRRYMRLQALLPLLVRRAESRSVLVVGLGTGITCGATLAWPNLDRRVCAELLPAVVEAVGRFEGNLGVGRDPNVSLRVADGRHLLLREADLWDVITLEPPPPVTAGAVNLYSRDFYEIARERLTAGGVLAQWFPLNPQNLEGDQILVRSFLDAFPHVSLWSTEANEMLLLGSVEPLQIDVPTLAERFAQPDVQRALDEVGVSDPVALLATYVTDRNGLETFVGDAPAMTDDRPRLEYVGLQAPGEFERVVAALLALQREPPLSGTDEDFLSLVKESRARLHLFYSAMLEARSFRHDSMRSLVKKVLAAEGNNPYYRFAAELGG